MKKFVRKIFIYIFVLGVSIGGLNYRWVKCMAPSYEDKFLSVPDEIKYFNMGSSHGLCSMYYEDLDEKEVCFNFAMQSQTLSYDYRILQQYDEHISQDAICFITISYFSLFEKEEESSTFLEKNTRYYRFLEPQYIKQYDPIVDICVRYLPVLSSGDNIFGILLAQPKKTNQFEDDWQRVTNAEEARINAENAIERHIIQYETNGEWKINQEEIQALEDIILFCKERDIQVIMISTPYLEEYNDRVPEEFTDCFISIISGISEKYEIDYYDYSSDERFSTDYNLFMNVDHLNKNGARKFTQILWNEIVIGQ